MKIVSKAYKFRFYPNKELISYLSQSFGCSRFIYNKVLDINKPKIKLDVNNILNTYAKLNSAVGATVDACEESQLIPFNKDSMKQESLPFRAR